MTIEQANQLRYIYSNITDVMSRPKFFNYVKNLFYQPGTSEKYIEYKATENGKIGYFGYINDGWGGALRLYKNGTLIKESSSGSTTIIHLYSRLSDEEINIVPGDIIKFTSTLNHGGGIGFVSLFLIE